MSKEYQRRRQKALDRLAQHQARVAFKQMPDAPDVGTEEYNALNAFDISKAEAERQQLLKDIEVFKGFETLAGIGQPLTEPIYGANDEAIYFADYFPDYDKALDLTTGANSKAAIDSVNPNTRLKELEKQINAARVVQAANLENNADFAQKSWGTDEATKLLGRLNNRMLTADERRRFFYIYNTQGVDAATSYIEGLRGDIQDRKVQNVYNFADDNEHLASLLSVGTQGLAALETGADLVTYFMNGGLTEAEAVMMARYTEALRSGASADLGEFQSLLYNTMMSGADSRLAMLIPFPGAGETVLGLSAAGSTMNDVLARGGSYSEAVTEGVWAGIFEGLFESLSIGNIKNVDKWLKSIDPKSVKDIAFKLAASMGVNASEEMATEIANIALDTAYMGELSNAALKVKEYVDAGMSFEDAKAKVSKEMLKQVGEAGLSGALMGGAFFGGAVGIHHTKTAAVKGYNAINKKAVQKRMAEVNANTKKNVPKAVANAEEAAKTATIPTATPATASSTTQSTTAEISKSNALEIVQADGQKLSEIYVEKDGNLVSLDQLSIEDGDLAMAYSYAATTGSVESANAFVKAYVASGENASPTQFWTAWMGIAANGQTLRTTDENMKKVFAEYGDTLSEETKLAAWLSGVEMKKTASERRVEAAAQAKATWEKDGKKVVKGKIDASALQGVELDAKQKEFVSFGKLFAEALGMNVTFTASKKGARKENGKYDRTTNTIYIDIFSGIDNKANYNAMQSALSNTLSHEVVHNMRIVSPEYYDTLSEYVFETLKAQGMDIDERIRYYMDEDNISRTDAVEEIVAHACDGMLQTSATVREFMEGFYKKDKRAANRFKQNVRDVLKRLKEVFDNLLGVKAYSAEAHLLYEAGADTVAEIQKIFDQGVTSMREGNLARNYEVQNSGKTGEQESAVNVVKQDLANKDVMFNLRATKSHKEKLSEQYSNSASISLEELTKRYDKIIEIWERLGGELNSNFLNEWNNKVGRDRAFTVFKAQAGYKYNVELSSMCKKGVPLFEAIDEIVKKEVMKELDSNIIGKAEKEILYDILKDHHFEIPCAICYVEQARQREGVIIDAFLNGKIEKDSKGNITTFKLGWNEVLHDIEKEMKANGVDYIFKTADRSIATDKYIPQDITMDSATQEKFYNALKKVANKEISRYNKAEGKNRKLVTDVTPSAIKDVFKGTLPSNLKIFKVLFTDPTSRFTIESDLLYFSMTTHNLATAHNSLYSLFNSQGGVSGYKTKQGAVVYWGDILGKKWSPSKVRDEGGIRNQSNSDFQVYTLLDQVQMYIDFSAKGYYLQAYTKVLSELKLFGLSRGKINASLIPAVYEYLNSDGSVDVEPTRMNAGLDRNGNLLFDDFEGINHNEAFMLLEDAEYSKSIGGTCIGYSDRHILKLLYDNRVQQIIGFHDKTDDPEKRYRGARYAKNYNGLNEAVNKDGKTVHIGFNPYVRKAEKMFTFNSKTETYEGKVEHNGKTYVADDIPKLAADLYLEMCEDKGYTPAYVDFASHENYYKLLADFSLYDSKGHYAPHRKVAYNMPNKVPFLDINGKKQYMATEDYIKAELKKELKVRDSIGEALADTSENGIIPQFKQKVKELHKSDADEMKQSRRTEKQRSLTKSDVEQSFGAIWDALQENKAFRKYANVKDFLQNETDYESVDWYADAFDFVDAPTAFNDVVGLFNDGTADWKQEWLLGDILEAYQNGTLDKFKLKDMPIETPTEAPIDTTPKTWEQKAQSVYDSIIKHLSDSSRKKAPTFEEVLSSKVSTLGTREAVYKLMRLAREDYEAVKTDRNKAYQVEAAINVMAYNLDSLITHKSDRYQLSTDRYSDVMKQARQVGAVGKRLVEADLREYLKAGTRANKSKEEALKQGKKIILTTETEITSFIDRSINKEKGLPTVAYGNVMDRLAIDVEEYSKGKIKIANDFLELVPSDISHAYEEHIKAKAEGDIDLTKKDFENIPEYIDNYDDLLYAIQYKTGNTRICLSKKISHGRVLLIETVSKSRGSLQFKNMIGVSEEKYISEYENIYKKRNRTNTGGNKRSNISPLDESVSKHSIPQSQQMSSGFDKNSSDELSQKRISTPDPSTILKDVIRNKVGAKEYGKYTESLKKYQDLDVRVRNQEKRIEEIDKEIKALKHNKAQSGKGARMDELYRQRKTAENKAEEYRNRMFAMESKELSGIVRAETEKARITAQREASEKYKKMSKERTENAEKRQYIEKIEKRAIKLSDLLKSNSKDKHIPEIFQQGVGEFLEALDFSSKRYLNGGAKTNKEINLETKMKNLVEILEGRAPGKDLNEFLEAAGLNDDDAKVIVTETLRKAYGEVYSLTKVYGDQDGVIVLQNLSAEQLRNINSALRTLNHLINQVNEVVSNSRYDSIMALGKATVDDCQAFKTYTKQGLPAQMDKFFKWTNALPYYAFRRMGKAASSVFESFMDGFDVYTDKITQVLEFTDKALNEKDVKKWSKEIHEFETISGEKLYMSTADIMSFYCLEKREQGNKHISGGGIVVPVRKGHLVGETKVQTFANNPKGVVVTDELRTKILMELTSEQVEVAKSLQEYMSTVCAEWGNEISMKRFGVRQFTEKFYFPVQSSENTLQKKDQVGSKERGIFHLLNASFTQNTNDSANNRIVVDNIFDVFAAHGIEMAKYNAFALQLIDTRKWLNYKTKTEINGQQFETEELRAMLENAFGKDAEKYIDTFLLDINGADKSGDRGLELLRSIVGNTKIAAVGLNLNVMLIQPTAYFRASAVINPKYLITEIKDTFQLRKAIERGEKYSGIFRWKSLGYRGFNLAAPISDKIKHTESFQSKFSENVSMKGAELMDKLTWGALWLACENETADLNKNLTKGSDEFYKAVAKRFREVIYTTQVVDSPLTKTEFMRSKGFANSLFGAFMSEPSTSYNLFLDVANDISDTKRKGQKIEKRHIAKLARVGVAFAVTELVTAVLRSFLDAAHDIDDEDDEYWELYLQNFAENYLEGLLMPKVPVINDIISAIIAAFTGGYSSSSLEMTSFERIAKFARNIWRLVNGKSVDWTKLFKSFFDAFSSASGLPISNVWREIVTIFNIIENASN